MFDPRRAALVSLVALAGCAADEGPAVIVPHDDHDDMMETTVPIHQATENGPVFEAHFDRAALERDFVVDGAHRVLAARLLPAPASRAAVWVMLADDQAPVGLEVEPGWSNGQTGPFRALEVVWSSGRHHVLAADLDTAATSLRVRIAVDDVARVETLRLVANIPLDPALRRGTTEDAAPPAGSTITPRSSWGAASARCATPNDNPKHVVLRRTVGGAPTNDHLEALQALALEGLGYCDVRSNYFVAHNAHTLGRGIRRGATAPTVEANQGRVGALVLSCDETPAVRTRLARFLDEITAAHGFDSATQFSVEDDGLCETDGAWLDAALAAWLDDAPFVMVPPPPPPPPPPEKGTVAGTVDAAQNPVAGATVTCTACPTTMTDAAGAFTFELEPGTHTLTIRAPTFVDATTSVTVVADDTVIVTVTLEPEPTTPGVSVIDHSFLIGHWGGIDADPFAFPETQDGFQQYLDAVGVMHFAAWEYVVPNNQQVATNCGFTILLPERGMWRRAAALGLLADRLRTLVNEPVTLRNWWRPPCYNEGVGGAPGGDHPDGDALDLDFRSARSRADAQRFLCETYWNQDIVPPEDIEPGSNLNPRLNMSVGLGGVTIHLGLLSRNGRRFWRYNSYTTETNSGNCW